MSAIGHNSGAVEAGWDTVMLHLGESQRLGRQSVESFYNAGVALFKQRKEFYGSGKERGPTWTRDFEARGLSERQVGRLLLVGEYGKSGNLPDFDTIGALVDWCRDERDRQAEEKAREERRQAYGRATAHRESMEAAVLAGDEVTAAAEEAAWESAEAESDRAATRVGKIMTRRENRHRHAALANEEEIPSVSTKYSDKAPSSNEHYTPTPVLEAAREAMGGGLDFDLDPASCAEANDVVMAERIFTLDDDGLAQEWNAERLWLNPPYSGVDLNLWVAKLLESWRGGGVKQACLLLHAATDTRYGQAALGACGAVCFPAGRLRFEGPSAGKGGAQIGQMILYYGPEPDRFYSAFRKIGVVLR